MLFNSFEFLFFFPVVTVLFFLLPHKYRWAHLLAASCYFYAAFVPAYLTVIAVVVCTGYVGALTLERSTGRARQRRLLLSVFVVVHLLCFFKYYSFFAEDLSRLLAATGAPASLSAAILFPLGLSFQTFQVLSYLFEVDKGAVKAERHFGLFALSVLFFPKLTAGPIERPQGFLAQLREEKFVDRNRIVAGLKLMLWGFFKKLVIADRLALYVNEVYLQPSAMSTASVWLAVMVFFPIQLYCDFSGYTSIAIGSARVMGYNLTENFRLPFSSVTLAEFWNRWHISLSTWLRDYIYQPVVIASRNWGKWAVVLGLMVTFFVSGFWHGAGWNFIVYGLFQGAVIALEFLAGVKAVKLAKSFWGRLRGRVVTYTLWALSLVFFRATDLSQAMVVLRKMFWDLSPSLALPTAIPKLTYALSVLAIGFLFYFEYTQLDRWVARRGPVRRELAYTTTLVVALIAFGVFHNLSFIYFKF